MQRRWPRWSYPVSHAMGASSRARSSFISSTRHGIVLVASVARRPQPRSFRYTKNCIRLKASILQAGGVTSQKAVAKLGSGGAQTAQSEPIVA